MFSGFWTGRTSRTSSTFICDGQPVRSRAPHPSLAGEMVDLGLLADAYQVIQQIERLADRALPLVRLSEKLVELEQRVVDEIEGLAKEYMKQAS